MRADLKCEGKEPSESDQLIVNAIGVTTMSIQSITELVGIKSKSDDLHGAKRTRQHTSQSVRQVRVCKTFLVSARFNAIEHEPEKEKQMMGILFMIKELHVIAIASIEE